MMLMRFRMMLQRRRINAITTNDSEDELPCARFLSWRARINNESFQRVYMNELQDRACDAVVTQAVQIPDAIVDFLVHEVRHAPVDASQAN